MALAIGFALVVLCWDGRQYGGGIEHCDQPRVRWCGRRGLSVFARYHCRLALAGG
jgi:hypothetical protein